MGNNISAILDYLEIPQVEMANILEISPQAMNSLIQSNNTKKYNIEIANYLGIDEEFITTDKLRHVDFLKIKYGYLSKKDQLSNPPQDKNKITIHINKKINILRHEIENEEIIEAIRELLNTRENEDNLYLIESFINCIEDKSTPDKMMKYEILSSMFDLFSSLDYSGSDKAYKIYAELLFQLKQFKEQCNREN